MISGTLRGKAQGRHGLAPARVSLDQVRAKVSDVTMLSPACEAFVAPARARPQIWRLVLGVMLIAAFSVLAIVGQFFLYSLFAGNDAATTLLAKVAVASTPASALLLFASFLPLIIGTVLAARLLHKRGAATLFGTRHRFWRNFFIAGAVIFACYGASLIPWASEHDSLPNLPTRLWLMLLPATIIVLGIQTLAEELLFRGYLQQQLAARSTWRVVWMLFPSVIFGLLHVDYETYGQSAIYAGISALVFGLLAADMTARTGNLGIAWGVHFANNFMAISLLATDGTVTGLALRVTSYHADEIVMHPSILVTDLLPLLIAWLVLRRLTRH